MSLIFDYQGTLITSEELAKLQHTYEESFPNLIESSFLVEIHETNAAGITTLNLEHRQKNEATDVLSFPLFVSLKEAAQHPLPEINLGSIVYAPEVASNLGENPVDLVHHGLLHLLGYDHETDLATWRQTERAIIKRATAHTLHLSELP